MAVTRLAASDEGVRRAGAALAAGDLVAFPTETVYGLGADGTNPRAVANIYRVKGRPADNPLILHVADAAAAEALAREWPDDARRLAERFWPGPLTLVVPARAAVPAVVRGGLDTVAVRCPSHPVARRLLAAAGVPVAAPSANRSGHPSPTTAEGVARALGGPTTPDVTVWLVDGGPSSIGVESTVVDVSGGRPLLLRPGGLPTTAIEGVVGALGTPAAGGPARSPGMRYRHYAPDRPLVLLAMDPEAAVAALAREGARDRWPKARSGLLAPRRIVEAAGWPAAVSLGDSPHEAAAALFEGLMTLDRWPGLDRLVAVWNNQEGVGGAVMDRLERAAAEVVQA